MYKAIKNNKIIAVSDTDREFPCLVKDSVVEDLENVAADFVQYNGEYLYFANVPAPTREEQSEKREQAYRVDVDPITCHINRLRDLEQTEEVVTEINQLIAQRATVVANIKERYPYPVEQ